MNAFRTLSYTDCSDVRYACAAASAIANGSFAAIQKVYITALITRSLLWTATKLAQTLSRSTVVNPRCFEPLLCNASSFPTGKIHSPCI